ncbi:MAG: hypothetical protein AAGA75_23635 [Cyanobacteria bacterium P01_E01_bin.6]
MNAQKIADNARNISRNQRLARTAQNLRARDSRTTRAAVFSRWKNGEAIATTPGGGTISVEPGSNGAVTGMFAVNRSGSGRAIGRWMPRV